jgi:predicted acyltransferase
MTQEQKSARISLFALLIVLNLRSASANHIAAVFMAAYETCIDDCGEPNQLFVSPASLAAINKALT